ncbi:MAG: hypothetical protein U0946_05730 [Patescibacteria group bacterium]|nr:hypothetical protein [Patescibacteria group bacterium]
MYRNRKTNYQKALLEQEKKVFSTADLAVLWEMENQNTLWTTIQRYLKREILYPIQRGLYATVSLRKLNSFELGCALAGPSAYISGETILQKNGLILQNVEKITLFGIKQKEFVVAGHKYLCRYLHRKYLLNRSGIKEKIGYSLASAERAVIDLWYINPSYYFDNLQAMNETKLKQLKRKVGYK